MRYPDAGRSVELRKQLVNLSHRNSSAPRLSRARIAPAEDNHAIAHLREGGLFSHFRALRSSNGSWPNCYRCCHGLKYIEFSGGDRDSAHTANIAFEPVKLGLERLLIFSGA